MNKYQEALNFVDNFVIDGMANGYDEPRIFCQFFGNELNPLYELVAEKTEQLSRKEKLVVGSEWECVADYMCALLVDSFTQEVRYLNKGNVVKVIDINEKYHTVFIRSVIHTYSVTLDQFLLCNKPKEPSQ